MDRHADSYRWKVPVNSVSRRLGLSLKRSGNACTDLKPIRPGIYSVCTMVRSGRGLTQPALVITCIGGMDESTTCIGVTCCGEIAIYGAFASYVLLLDNPPRECGR